jgi:predicted O-methyltransferase YrrM
MSNRATIVDDRLFEYLKNNFSSEDEFLAELQIKAKEAGLPPISISPEQGKFMQFLLHSVNAKHVLEIGTLGAYSAITMARALPDDGKLITVENEPKHYEFACKMVSESGLEHKIEVVLADGKNFVKEYRTQNQFDFVFVDADKPSYLYYLNNITPKIKIGGIFAADNAFAFGFILDSKPERNPDDVKSIRSFNEYFRTRDNYFTCIVPVGDGIIMGYKKY